MHAAAATRLHVELTAVGPDTFSLHAVDATGAPVISIDTVTLRDVPTTFGQGAPAAVGLRDSFFELSLATVFTDHRARTGPQRGLGGV